jgi:HAD superfamily hydrolase (TIGR01456 family)
MRSKGLVIDVDGVLIHGVAPIAGARECLERIGALGLPHVFVTNGGGVPRQEKARSLAKILGVEAETIAQRLVSAHDPIGGMLEQQGLRDKRVLVLSKSEAYSRGVAAEWGLTDAVVLEDYLAGSPWLFPLLDDGRAIVKDPKRVSAICVVATPAEWGQSLQLCCDLLLNGGLLYPDDDHMPPPALFVSNPDFDYRARAPLVRMTTGAWLHALSGLMQHYGAEAKYVLAGKPHAPIYELAKKTLGAPCERVYCIGDNPEADMRGAIDNGFVGVLVLTGVAARDDPRHPAHIVASDVTEALEAILKH